MIDSNEGIGEIGAAATASVKALLIRATAAMNPLRTFIEAFMRK
jgi:hypothetical protein